MVMPTFLSCAITGFSNLSQGWTRTRTHTHAHAHTQTHTHTHTHRHTQTDRHTHTHTHTLKLETSHPGIMLSRGCDHVSLYFLTIVEGG